MAEKRGIDWYRKKVANIPKYKSLRWEAKVYSMPPRQVIAIYKNFKKLGTFNEKPTKNVPTKDDSNYQYTIFDYI